MSLTPEDRRRIYEEEKARIEAEQPSVKKAGPEESTTSLEPNVAGLLCYLGLWVTGIIFLVLEKKNRTVRFHAAQSLVIFGFLGIMDGLLSLIPVIGWLFGTVVSLLTLVLWIVLMVKTYQGELWRIPVAAELADEIIGSIYRQENRQSPTRVKSYATEPAPVFSRGRDESPRPYLGRLARITAYAFGIAWDVVLLIFFNFFSRFIAYYHQETVSGHEVWFNEPLTTSEFSRWLPIITMALLVSIAGNIVMIIVDLYSVRQAVRIVMDVVAIWAIGTLIAIFPFDFSVIPSSDIADMMPWLLKLVLAIVIFGLAIAVVVRIVKLILSLIGIKPRP